MICSSVTRDLVIVSPSMGRTLAIPEGEARAHFGYPKTIRVDQSSEFVCRDLLRS